MSADHSSRTALVRERRTTDLPGAAAALVDVYSTDQYPVEGVDEPIPWLSPENTLIAWVAELDGDIVGQVAVAKPTNDTPVVQARIREHGGTIEDYALLARLFVRKSGRGHKLGAALTHAAVQWARDNSKRLVLNVLDKDMGAMVMYEKLGWQRFGSGRYTTAQGQSWGEFFYISPE